MIWSRTSVLTLDSLKCSLYLSVTVLFSFSSASLIDRSEVVLGLDGPYTVAMELKSFFGVLSVGVLLDLICLHHSSCMQRSATWAWL